MLIYNLREIGNRLYAIRKKAGQTQIQVAVASDISERAYADIERGNANMRLITLLRICDALHITPNELLTDEQPPRDLQKEEMLKRLSTCSIKDQDTALQLLDVYLKSLYNEA